MSPRTIQELLGHRSVTITEGYIASSGRHRDAVVRLDMGVRLSLLSPLRRGTAR